MFFAHGTAATITKSISLQYNHHRVFRFPTKDATPLEEQRVGALFVPDPMFSAGRVYLGCTGAVGLLLRLGR